MSLVSNKAVNTTRMYICWRVSFALRCLYYPRGVAMELIIIGKRFEVETSAGTTQQET